VVQDNVAGLTSTLTIRGDNASDDAVTLGSETLTFKGDTGLTSTVSSNTVTFDLDDTAVTAGVYGGVSGGVTNVASVTIDATGRITNAANVSVVTNLDTLQDNINLLDANADSIEARRVANVFFTYNPTGAANVIINTANLEPSANNTYSLGAPDKVWKDLHVGPGSIFIGANTALKADANGDVQIVQSTDNAPRTLVVDRLEIGTGANKVRLQNNGGRLRQINRGNPNIADDSASDKDLDNVQSNVAAVEARRVANVTVSSSADTALQARLTTNVTAFTTEDTALQSRLATNVTALTTEDTALQARITANNTLTSAVETRRTQNIAGAISTITTADLTASRAMVTNGSGKVAASDVTATELGYLDGVTSAIQTQLDAKSALAGATFTGQVNMSDDLVVTGNLTVNGVTTTVSSTNLDVADRLIMLANGTTGSPSADVGLLFNRGNQGNAAIFYDESAKTFKLSDTKDPKSNTSLSPVTASNLDVGILTASTVKFDGADLSTAISDNVSTLNTSITAVEARRTNNVAGAVSTITTSDLTASRALVSSGSGKVAVSAVTATEIGYLDGVSSAIQTQLDAKSTTSNATALALEDAALQSRLATNVTAFTTEDTALQARITANNTLTSAVETRRTQNIAGAVSTITTSDLTASRAVVTNGSGKVAVSAVTSTEIGYLDGVTSAIQTQLDAKLASAGANNFTDNVTITSTSAGAENNPEFALVRNSSSPADNDLLGTFVFKGKNDAAEETVYGSFQTRANDVSDGTEDGNMFFKVMTNGTLEDRLALKGANPTLFSTQPVRLNSVDLEFRASSKTTTVTPGSPNGDITITLPSTTSTLATTTTTDALETRRAANIAGAVSTITTSDLTASRALVSGSGGKVEVSAITATELAFLDGIDQNINSNLTALAAGIAASSTGDFPTGDYGLLDTANAATDSFAIAIAGLTQFDMSTSPTGSLATEDLGALS
jgi:hypothetical protein